MRTEILVTLLFVAAASASIDGASDDGTGMCPMTYLKKHLDVWKKNKEFMKKYGFPDFSKLKSCSSDGTCDKGMKCCETPCGMKCMKAVFEDNALETIGQILKEIGTGVDDKPYEITEEDKKYGMCPNNYVKVHPEVKEELEKKCSHKHSHECKEGEKCSHGKQDHFTRLTALADCSVDGDCSNNMRCCSSMCGKKCMKPVFTNEDLKESLYGKKEENVSREKRDVQGKGQEEGGKHGKGHGKGGKHGKGHGKGGKHGKGDEEGGKHGKGHEKGGKHGKGHEKGGKHGKGHGKGGKHGKGHEKSKQ